MQQVAAELRVGPYWAYLGMETSGTAMNCLPMNGYDRVTLCGIELGSSFGLLR